MALACAKRVLFFDFNVKGIKMRKLLFADDVFRVCMYSKEILDNGAGLKTAYVGDIDKETQEINIESRLAPDEIAEILDFVNSM